VKRLALKSALTSKVVDGEIIVIDKLQFDTPKTKDMVEFLGKVNAEKKSLIVTADKEDTVIKSAANIPGIGTTQVGTLNVYDILNHTSFIVTKDAISKIEEVYS
jgi:large subunit ribosomal protein L4